MRRWISACFLALLATLLAQQEKASPSYFLVPPVQCDIPQRGTSETLTTLLAFYMQVYTAFDILPSWRELDWPAPAGRNFELTADFARNQKANFLINARCRESGQSSYLVVDVVDLASNIILVSREKLVRNQQPVSLAVLDLVREIAAVLRIGDADVTIHPALSRRAVGEDEPLKESADDLRFDVPVQESEPENVPEESLLIETAPIEESSVEEPPQEELPAVNEASEINVAEEKLDPLPLYFYGDLRGNILLLAGYGWATAGEVDLGLIIDGRASIFAAFGLGAMFFEERVFALDAGLGYQHLFHLLADNSAFPLGIYLGGTLGLGITSDFVDGFQLDVFQADGNPYSNLVLAWSGRIGLMMPYVSVGPVIRGYSIFFTGMDPTDGTGYVNIGAEVAFGLNNYALERDWRR